MTVTPRKPSCAIKEAHQKLKEIFESQDSPKSKQMNAKMILGCLYSEGLAKGLHDSRTFLCELED